MSSDEQRFGERLITKRNSWTIHRIVAYYKSPKTYFVVAGAAHFVGDNSIIDQLRKRGFTPERL